MKKNYIIPIILGVTGIALIYSYLKKNKGGKSDGKTFTIDVPEPEKIGEADFNIGTDKFPMGSGAKGYNVQQLQIALGGKEKLPISFAKNKPDGKFGLETERVLEEQTGKKTVDSMLELEKIAQKNGLVKAFTKDGYTFVAKSKQNILAKVPSKPF